MMGIRSANLHFLVTTDCTMSFKVYKRRIVEASVSKNTLGPDWSNVHETRGRLPRSLRDIHNWRIVEAFESLNPKSKKGAYDISWRQNLPIIAPDVRTVPILVEVQVDATCPAMFEERKPICGR